MNLVVTCDRCRRRVRPGESYVRIRAEPVDLGDVDDAAERKVCEECAIGGEDRIVPTLLEELDDVDREQSDDQEETHA